MTEEEVKKLIQNELKSFAADYYRESHPGFEVTSGGKTLGHGETDYCMTTDKRQGVHFYKSGVAKIFSNKSMEIYSGEGSNDKELSIMITADQGSIKITAEAADLILEGRNVIINSTSADGGVSIQSKKTVYFRTPEFIVDSTMFTASATLDMLLSGGNLALYSEAAPVQSSTGVDSILGPTIFDTVFNVLTKARTFFKR